MNYSALCNRPTHSSSVLPFDQVSGRCEIDRVTLPCTVALFRVLPVKFDGFCGQLSDSSVASSVTRVSDHSPDQCSDQCLVDSLVL